MSKPVKGSRTYASPLRERQRAATRAAVIEAAADRFVDQGYAATSIAEIARAAGVSPETVYGTFGTKREVLRAAWRPRPPASPKVAPSSAQT